jgi:hypothetical protein
MPEKSSAKVPDDIPEFPMPFLRHMDERFDAIELKFHQVNEQFDSQSTGLEERVSTLEARMRVVASKMGIEFGWKI